MPEMGPCRRILVIRLSSLGDIVQSLGCFAAIRRHHPNAHIVLLTAAPYADWLRKAPYFDEVWIDELPGRWDLPRLARLRRQIVGGGFDRVYDLQTSRRSNRYFQFFRSDAIPEWSGIAPGCSHPDADPARNRLHNLDRQAGQLRAAGIDDVPPPDLGWSSGDITRFGLPERFALLVPGTSSRHLDKRWPAECYAALARILAGEGIASLVVGAAAEATLATTITGRAPAIDLTGRTGFDDLATLARAATVAVGNDTGPMHLIAAAGCPSVMLLSAGTDPAHCAPRGDRAGYLRRHSLSKLDAALVGEAALAKARCVSRDVAAV